MDSLTQITLGAAVGELALGKKVGNKAMVWGAIGGTIPDLDVFANLVTDEISAMAFHRAFTHSLIFGVVAPLILGWLIHHFYEDGARSAFWKRWAISFGLMLALVFVGSVRMPIPWGELLQIALVVSTAILFFPAILFLLRKRRPIENPSWRAWFWLFFGSVLTHPLLDACTAYGTQLFQPLSDYRVAWNNISVVDPLYTFPFLFFVIWASRKLKDHPRRAWLNYIGLGISSLYLVLTFVNKSVVNQVFKDSLAKESIVYERYMTSPSIFNNILWQGVAETGDAFHHGRYSLLDSEAKVASMYRVEKGHELLAPYEGERAVKILKWFSAGYYSVVALEDGKLQFNDLRYGTFPAKGKQEQFVFQFILEPENGKLQIKQQRPVDQDAGEAFRQLWERIKGI
ncbi:MAG: metal-dependent hydrolase [Saprospiraceae bacterium]|nr:metal-dependent hydrolase [Saprospiraceae bacterium]